MTWPVAPILYEDAELLLCDRTRGLLDDQNVLVGRRIPEQWTRLVVWNRLGGSPHPPFDVALMQCRVFAPTDQECVDLARILQARLPMLCDGSPITNIAVTGGPSDLGVEDSPMRQYLYDITIRGRHETTTP
jgi:hypothetical protein